MHKQITLATDASLFKYGVSVLSDGQETLNFGDFWDNNDKRPIHLKEAEALIRALQSLGSSVHNQRVDILTDNKAVIAAWENQGVRDKPLNDIMKSLFTLTYSHNIDLHLTYIASNQIKADAPSRSISLADSKLSDESWALVEMSFGPHTVDLMSLDSNVMKTPEGVPLRHFTPSPSPFSAAVNVFAQDITKEENPYVNPPINIILPLLKFLKDQRIKQCTFITPVFGETPIWYPILKQYIVSSITLGVKGQTGVLEIPSKNGFVLDNKGLRWTLLAHRLCFI